MIFFNVFKYLHFSWWTLTRVNTRWELLGKNPEINIALTARGITDKPVLHFKWASRCLHIELWRCIGTKKTSRSSSGAVSHSWFSTSSPSSSFRANQTDRIPPTLDTVKWKEKWRGFYAILARKQKSGIWIDGGCGKDIIKRIQLTCNR